VKILVTGARGFVGKEVVRTLEKRGFEVIATGIAHGGLYLDVRLSHDVCAFMARFKPDVVIHLAALVAGQPSLKNPYEYYYTNIVGTLNILESMRLNGINKIVFMSSWATYGKPELLPITEKTPLCSKNPYGISKKCCEELVKSYAKSYGIKAVILRPTMIYGPEQTEKNVIQQIVDCISSGKLFEVYGIGEHTRECLYVTDVAEAIIKSIGFLEYTQSPYEIFVLGTGKPYSVKKMLNIGQSIGEFPVTFKGVSIWAFSQASDITKAKKLLKWKPKVDFREGLKKILRAKKGVE